MLQKLGTRVVSGGGGLLQHLSKNVAFLMHCFGGGIRPGGVEVNKLAADETIELCLCRAGDAVLQQGAVQLQAELIFGRP